MVDLLVHEPIIETDRLMIRMCQIDEAPQVVSYVGGNRNHLEAYSPTYGSSYFSEGYWKTRLGTYLEEFQNGQSLCMFIFLREEPNTVIGTINFTSILKKAAHFCYLGYGLAESCQGMGYMTEAVKHSVEYVFSQLNLHRIMANYIPINERSGRVLRRAGFTVEGYARDYLLINGKWQDHILTSITNDRWQGDPK